MNPRPSGLPAKMAPEPDVLSWLSSLLCRSDLDYGPVFIVLFRYRIKTRGLCRLSILSDL